MAAVDVSGTVHGAVDCAPKQTEAVHMSKIAHKVRAPPKGLVIGADGQIAGCPVIVPSPKHAGVECKKKEFKNRSQPPALGRKLSVGSDGIVHEQTNGQVCVDADGTIHAADVVVGPKSPSHAARLKEVYRKRCGSSSDVLCSSPDGSVQVVDTATPSLDASGVVQLCGSLQPMSPCRSKPLNSLQKAHFKQRRQVASSPTILAVDKSGRCSDALWLPWDAAPAAVCAAEDGTIHAADVTCGPKSPAHLAKLKDAHKRRTSASQNVLCSSPDGSVQAVDTATPAVDASGVVRSAGAILPMSPSRSQKPNAVKKALFKQGRASPTMGVLSVDEFGLAHEADTWNFWLPSAEVACC